MSVAETRRGQREGWNENKSRKLPKRWRLEMSEGTDVQRGRRRGRE
jgi:hypothetical protein